MEPVYSRNYDYFKGFAVLVNGSGHNKVKRKAWTPRGARTYYDSSEYMPHVGAKQQAKALRKTA